jgi:Tfp pilus assembly protein PilN
MNGFNLLPEQFRRRRGAQFVPISIVVTIGIAVLCVLLMELAIVSRALGGSGSTLRDTLADRRRDVEAARTGRRDVVEQVEALAGVLPRTPVWSNLLIDVAQTVGPRVQLERWSSDADRGVCSIRGHAESNSDVFEFVAALEATPHFASVTLAGVSRKEDADRRSDDEQGTYDVVFEVVCRLRQAVR